MQYGSIYCKGIAELRIGGNTAVENHWTEFGGLIAATEVHLEVMDNSTFKNNRGNKVILHSRFVLLTQTKAYV